MAEKLSKGAALIGQSGGPTAVINQSLVGVVEELRATLVKRGIVKRVYGMRHGVNGLVKGELVDLTRYPAAKLQRVAITPSAALGSSRDKPDAEYCARILERCREIDARYFFYIGGNDSSDTCRIVSELAASAGYEMRCFHVPKTIDNDLMGSDHTPGFPSAARFQALAFMSDSMDNASLPGVKINVVMGRHAGFLTAASALARGSGKYTGHNGPHLIYCPEIPFDSTRFLQDIERVYTKLGRCQVAVSEGIQDANGEPIVATLLKFLEKDSHGNLQLSGVGALGDALADHVKNNLKLTGSKLRVRADTFGYLQRCWPDPSPIDSKEARTAGKMAVKHAARGEMSGSIAITRAKGKLYKPEFNLIKLSDVAAKTRHMPQHFFEGHCDISKAYLEYLRPLVGTLPVMERI